MTNLKPSKKQLEFLEWEMGLFVHFGIRTFYEGYRDWDHKAMDPVAFNPTKLDCGQWIKTAADAGMKYAILTAKHHDGFANWPTQFSEYSVKATPWKDGKGDVVREFTDACRKYGIKAGIYYSPADYTSKENTNYDDYFINQVTELLTNYGTIEIIWFDGCGSEGHEYDWKRIIAEIRRLQPSIRIFNMGDPDIRWIGNEVGVAPLENWNEVSSVPFSVMTDEREKLDSGMLWLPGECDFRMREANWFYSDYDEETVKSVDELLGLYEYSVGRGANFLINIGPNREGLLPEKDARHLKEFGQEIRNRFSKPLATIDEFKRNGEKLHFYAKQSFLTNCIVLSEDMTEGQSIRRFKVSTLVDGTEIILYEGKTVGHKAICRFPTIRLGNLTVEIIEHEKLPSISSIELFHFKY